MLRIAASDATRARPRVSLRVSFDIDDTLVCDSSVPTEQYVPLWYRARYREQVRRGSRDLMFELIARGCKLWIYTTSRRRPHYLFGWFRCMGIALEGVVTQAKHEELVGYRGPSKLPPAFGIGLHVDDSPGVAIEGRLHGFRVVLVDPHNENWGVDVLAAVDELLGQAVPGRQQRVLTPIVAV